MQIQSSLVLAFASLLAASDAYSQVSPTPQPLKPTPIPSAVRYGGTFHVAAGTWTRGGGSRAAGLGPDIIYSNTAPSSYFSSAGGNGGFAQGSENFDEGGLPGRTNPGPFAGTPVNEEYEVNCVSIGYCDTGQAGGAGYRLNFFSDYTPCTFDPSPDATVIATGLPAAGCWTIDLDLSGGEEFCLAADGLGQWAGSAVIDSFGWSYQYAGTGTLAAGFLLQGNPIATDPGYVSGLPTAGSNTYYGATLCPGTGTGYITQDFWWLEDPTGVNSNCFFFGGYSNNGTVSCNGPTNPYASWHLELAADTSLSQCSDCLCQGAYCSSTPNSTGVPSTLELFGSDVALDNNLEMRAEVPRNVFGFFLTSQTQGFTANPAGSQGNLCLAGGIGRFVAPGQIKNSGPDGQLSLSTRTGEFTLASMPQGGSFYAAAVGVTSNFQLWHRDSPSTSNFSDAQSVTWN